MKKILFQPPPLSLCFDSRFHIRYDILDCAVRIFLGY